ncbi:MAG: hypothetical protein QOJ92_119 [Frankiales bacterium]|nr:hypothetical protein [Frankiales bacterium]
MIDPAIAMHDLDDGGWAVLTRWAAQRDRTPPDELHVLHESGRVLSAVLSSSGPLAELPVLGPDLEVTARALRDEYGVQRVVIVDADGLTPVLAAEAAHGTRHTTQPELLAALQAAFWSSPGVVSDSPPPPPGQWPVLFRRLAHLGDGSITLVTDSIRLVGRVRGGRLVEVTTMHHTPGDVVLALHLTDPELAELMHAPDVAAALLARPELAEHT